WKAHFDGSQNREFWIQESSRFRRGSPKLCEKKFQIFQIFENDFRKSLKINERKAEPEGFEPSVRF
ncbi:MAG: hypothetical protein LV479_10395, partial [Methylacidiphilales bacterium]|nr:hypothetical protein [Candidatus Methylacidiphilales bacterium]